MSDENAAMSSTLSLNEVGVNALFFCSYHMIMNGVSTRTLNTPAPHARPRFTAGLTVSMFQYACARVAMIGSISVTENATATRRSVFRNLSNDCSNLSRLSTYRPTTAWSAYAIDITRAIPYTSGDRVTSARNCAATIGTHMR